MMKNENGVTLATVILTVIVILLIASTSIVVGNRLIVDAKEQKAIENYETVVAAVGREIAKINTSGIITPGIYSYIGVSNPIIGKDDAGNSITTGEDWYLLDASALEELGIKDSKNTYLVNYKLNVVIDIDRTNDLATEIAKYQNNS